MPLDLNHLRSYQKKIIQDVREALRVKRSVLLEAPTGAGKSVILAGILKMFFENIHKQAEQARAYVMVHQTFLLNQMSAHLEKWGIPHGLITAGWKERPGCRIHVCTIQSLIRRPPIKPPGLMIIDEAHRAGSKGYKTVLNMFSNCKIIGVTATPERGDGKSLATPDGHFDLLLPSPVGMLELTEMGFLSPIKYFAPPINGLDDIKVENGDYKEIDLQEFMKRRKIYGNAIDHYKKLASGKSCLVFCRTVASCKYFCDELKGAGYKAKVLEGAQNSNMRNAYVKGFENGDITHLVTCRLVLEGVDIPAIGAVLDLAPTTVRGLWRQKVGRLVRPAPGKEYGVYIDPVGNAVHHSSGDIYEEIKWAFAGRKRRRPIANSEAAARFCSICFCFMGNLSRCPNCETVRKPKPVKDEVVEGVELKELGAIAKTDPRQLIIKLEKARRESDWYLLTRLMRAAVGNDNAAIELYFYMAKTRHMVDEEVLAKTRRAFNYKPGWSYYARPKIKERRREQTEIDRIILENTIANF